MVMLVHMAMATLVACGLGTVMVLGMCMTGIRGWTKFTVCERVICKLRYDEACGAAGVSGYVDAVIRCDCDSHDGSPVVLSGFFAMNAL